MISTFFRDLTRQTEFLYRSVLICILFIFVYLFITDNKGQVLKKIKELFKTPWVIAFLFYAAFIITSTILARRTLNPYNSIFNSFGFFTDGKFNLEFAENVVLFIPYTFLYIKAFKPQRVVKSCFYVTICTTCFIELSQFFFWLGEFQFSDMLHNIEGGMIGCGLWYAVKNIKEKIIANGKH